MSRRLSDGRVRRGAASGRSIDSTLPGVKSPGQLHDRPPEFLATQRAVFVGIEPLEAGLDQRRCFLLTEFAVLIGPLE
ncbi:MAG: hypothetical protein HQ581_05500 [Planctomycetes bacterium]|nr:hypothetical protein [Planctomycetota bacterium]